MPKCRICGNNIESELLSFGAQPVCNRFMATPSMHAPCYPLSIMQCPCCALLQLAEMRTPDELRPTFDWISYNEPEGHLNSLADQFISAIPMHSSAKILGITYKDDSTIERFRQRGFSNTRLLQPQDIGVTIPCAGLETLQAQLTLPHGTVFPEYAYNTDIVVARHLLEHTDNPRALLNNLAMLLNPGGVLLIEAPDITPALQSREHVVIWEEHAIYFTAATFRRSMAALGFDVLMEKSAEYPLENCHIMALRQGRASKSMSPPAALEWSLAADFAHAFPKIKENIHGWFKAHHERHSCALMGAGHLACKFINFHGVRDYISMIIDDHPKKQGLFMPGSHLPIKASTALVSEKIKFCLMSVNPLNEDKIIARQDIYTQNGGICASIFASSPRFILR